MAKKSIYFELPDLGVKHDMKVLKKGIDAIHGVVSVSVNTHDKKVAIDYDSTGTDGEKITEKIKELGFTPHITDTQEHIM
jgi:Copper chaperone